MCVNIIFVFSFWMTCIKLVREKVWEMFVKLLTPCMIDEPSLDLLQALVNCKVNVLIFISYRDQELTEAQNALLHNDVANIQLLKIEPLDKSSLLDLLCDVLHRPRENKEARDELQPLAEVIDRRTKGNAFYTTQFLQTLERKKLIWFDWESSEWTYDLNKIEESTLLSNMKADSQLDVGFMVAKLKELSRDGQHLLKLASSVGDSFSWEMVRTLMMDCELDDQSVSEGDSSTSSIQDDDNDDDDRSTYTSISESSSITQQTWNEWDDRTKRGKREHVC